MTMATCAKCGQQKELCESARVDGIKQPRICKDCLIVSMKTGDYTINETFWTQQMLEFDDTESINNLT